MVAVIIIIITPGGGEIFRTRPDRPWGPPSLLYNGYRVFPTVKRPGRCVDHPLPSSAEVGGRVELYICSPSGPSWPVIGRPLPLPSIIIIIIMKLVLGAVLKWRIYLIICSVTPADHNSTIFPYYFLSLNMQHIIISPGGSHFCPAPG